MIEDKKVLMKLNECIEKNKLVAMVIIINTDGSTPRGVGSTMLVDDEGNLIEGTIGGGVLEEKSKQDAMGCIKRGKSTLIEYNLDSSSENSNTLPMTCGGNVSVFIKVYKPREKLVIAGAGHVSEKVSRLANLLGYSVTILDDREERLTHEIFPDVDNLIFGAIADNLNKENIDRNTFVIIATHGHRYDQDALEAVLESDAKYIGMIGSINKIRVCFSNLLANGYTKEQLSRVYTPIGIDIGGETPEEIALAVMAEVQAVKYEKNVPHLSNDISKFA